MGLEDELIKGMKTAHPESKSLGSDAVTITPEIKQPELNPVDQVIETQPKETTLQTKTENTVFDVSDFNVKYGKRFNREIKEEKELEEIFSASSKISDYKAKLKVSQDEYGLTKKQFDELSTKYESEKEALKFIDIKKYFANDKLYKTNEMLKKYPDKDISTMTEISNMDLEKADNVDLLVKRARLNDSDIYKGMDDSQVKEVIADSLGSIDLDEPDSWDNVTKAKIAKAAKEARIEFKALQDIELPVPVDVEKVRQEFASKEKERYEQTKSQWSPIVDKMVANFTELVIPDEEGKELYKYTPELNDGFKAEISKYVDFLAYTGQPLNESTITEVLESIKGRYIVKELPKIMKAHALKVSTEVEDKWHNKVNNDKPLSDKSRPVSDGNDIWSKMADLVKY